MNSPRSLCWDRKYFTEVYSVELVESASRDGEKNSIKNGVKNVRFMNMKVEDFAKSFEEQ
jgi:tRNA/tmRNA/rRNA uracil-C5-methylase (TrmA/RlmC/RlmD family)